MTVKARKMEKEHVSRPKRIPATAGTTAASSTTCDFNPATGDDPHVGHWTEPALGTDRAAVRFITRRDSLSLRPGILNVMHMAGALQCSFRRVSDTKNLFFSVAVIRSSKRA